MNLEQNQNMIHRVLEWAALEGGERVLDLYCGMGNFSLPLAGVAGEVVGMDAHGASIRSAGRNAHLNNMRNCRFEKSSALAGAKRLAAGKAAFDLVLLDPPREGCAKILPYIPQLGAERLIYISCDPATLARDLLRLVEYGYAITRLALVDMFPQTHHMEVMALLERR